MAAKERRTEVVKLSLYSREAEPVRRAAEADGVPLAVWIRRAALAEARRQLAEVGR